MQFMYKAKMINVIDGDTIDFYVNLGLGFFCNARIRLVGVDAPEIFKVKKTSEEFKQGQIAKLVVKKWFIDNPCTYFLRAEHRGLYGRWLGEIWYNINEISLNEYLKMKFYKTKYWSWYHQEPLTEKW